MQRMREAMEGMAMLMEEREEDWRRDREELGRLQTAYAALRRDYEELQGDGERMRRKIVKLEGEVRRLTALLRERG